MMKLLRGFGAALFAVLSLSMIASVPARAEVIEVYGTTATNSKFFVGGDATYRGMYVTFPPGYTPPAAGVSGASTFWNDTTTALTGSATYTGTGRDAGYAAAAPGNRAYFNAFVLADQTGTFYLDCSNDNTTFYVCATAAIVASTPLTLTTPVMTRYHRARVVNGSTGQGSLRVNTSYTGG